MKNSIVFIIAIGIVHSSMIGAQQAVPKVHQKAVPKKAKAAPKKVDAKKAVPQKSAAQKPAPQPQQPAPDFKAQRQAKLNEQLFDAIKKNNLKEVALSLVEGADPNASDKYGIYPLELATKLEQLTIADVLIKEGARVNQQNADGDTVLMIALKHDHAPLARRLLSEGTDVSLQNIQGLNALDIARKSTKPEIKSLIPQIGAQRK